LYRRDERGDVDAFVYGTLRDPERTRDLLGHANFGPDARVVGLGSASGRYPTLAPGPETDGRVLRLSGEDLTALDAYEGVDRGLYARVRIPGDDRDCWTYVGDPDALGVDVEWPGDGPLEARVERYVAANDVRVEM
jgi:gamma-glutamylcyclotransferase (GGCT)/AIG2-like uncharacterized protein YtfP